MFGAQTTNAFSGVWPRFGAARSGTKPRFSLACATIIALVLPSIAAAQSGACCNPSGSCTLGSSSQCVSGGAYQGNGTSCASVVCPQPIGACCNGSGGCTQVGRQQCQLAGSTYIADGVACGTNAVCPIGACCLSDGSCTAGLSQANCQTLGGGFQGNATTCVVVACPVPIGACCSTTSCAALNLNLCTLFNGTWRGPNTACGPNNTCPATGVCCRGLTCSTSIAQTDCTPPAPGIGARFAANAAACNTAGSHTTPCCHADFNGSGTISPQDIFDFLNAWFAASPYAHIGGNGVTPPTVQDIFDFLGAWFGGC